MNKVVWKYVIPHSGTSIRVPRGGLIISCQMQNGEPTVWMEHTHPVVVEIVIFEFKIVPTGVPFVADGFVCVGTCQDTAEALVWHLYLKVNHDS